MKLINEKCPNMKFHINGEIVSSDAKGVIHVKDEAAGNALLASGFKSVFAKGDKEEPKEEPKDAPEPVEQPKIENPVLEPKAEETKSWKRR